MTGAQAQARSICRRGLSAALRQVPSSAFSALRHSFPTTAPASVRHELQRRVLEVVRHRGVPSEIDVFALVDNPSVSLVNSDSFVIERLYWFGERFGYEPEVLMWWRHYCARSSKILELGANVGYFTVQGAQAARTADYTAVEPHPGAAAICRRNVSVNGLQNVRVVQAAAVPVITESPLELRLPGGRDHYTQAPCTGFVGDSEVHQEPEVASYEVVRVEPVEFRSLMSGTDLLKLDVEGLEHDLLHSIRDVLRSRRPTLFLEVLDATPKLRSLVADLCGQGGYDCFVPTVDGLVPLAPARIATVRMAAEFGTRDLLVTCDPPI